MKKTRHNRVASTDITVAEAVLTCMLRIAEIFGSVVAELQALDTGSGKLVEWYKKLGFTECPGYLEDDGIAMEAPVKLVSQQAPRLWVDLLLPKKFDPQDWLQHSLKQTLHIPSSLPLRHQWSIAWPRQCHIEVCCDNQVVVATAANDRRRGLVSATSSVLPERKCLRVHWLGSRSGGAAHFLARSVVAYKTPRSQATLPIGLLGILCALARALGLTMVEMQVFDDGSGRLIRHFEKFGFEEAPAPPDGGEDSWYGPWMRASCAAAEMRCCPAQWRTILPPPGSLVGLPCNAEKETPLQAGFSKLW